MVVEKRVAKVQRDSASYERRTFERADTVERERAGRDRDVRAGRRAGSHQDWWGFGKEKGMHFWDVRGGLYIPGLSGVCLGLAGGASIRLL